jgi:hypothetical protein
MEDLIYERLQVPDPGALDLRYAYLDHFIYHNTITCFTAAAAAVPYLLYPLSPDTGVHLEIS